MRLLICSQAIDVTDSDLGFFHRWVEEFSKHFEEVHILCLRAGAYSLPNNVVVHSLGKETGTWRAKRWLNALKFIVSMRNRYDAVFVHMNPEYVVLGGLLWRLWGKKVALWYVHKSVTMKLRVALLFVHAVFTASRESFRIASRKVHVVGHGIDIDFFNAGSEPREMLRIFSAGRLSKTKRVDLILRACALVATPFSLIIAGEGEEQKTLLQQANALGIASSVHFVGPLSSESMRREYRKASVFVHTSETGSMDKVVLEALLCECPVVTTSTVYAELPVVTVKDEPAEIARAIAAAPPVSINVSKVRAAHSLSDLIVKISNWYGV